MAAVNIVVMQVVAIVVVAIVLVLVVMTKVAVTLVVVCTASRSIGDGVLALVIIFTHIHTCFALRCCGEHKESAILFQSRGNQLHHWQCERSSLRSQRTGDATYIH